MRFISIFRQVTLVVIVITNACFALGQQTSAGKRADHLKKLEATLMELQRQEDEAEGKRDVAALDRLFADESFLVLGKVVPKADFIRAIVDTKTELLPASEFKYDEVAVRDLGNTAVVSYRVTYFGKNSAGKEETNRFRVLVVWVKSGNRWQIAAGQAQPLQ